MSWAEPGQPWHHPGYSGTGGPSPAGFQPYPLDDYLAAYDDMVADMVADMFGFPRRARTGDYGVPRSEPGATGVRIVPIGTLEYRAISDSTPIQVGPVDPCRFPGIAPKITAMQ